MSVSAQLADDIKEIAELFADHLEDLGLKADEAHDRQIAIEKVMLKKYNYVCTDMSMPEFAWMYVF